LIVINSTKLTNIKMDTNAHLYQLVFRIQDDTPEKFMKKWGEFKLKCESGENEHIVEQMKVYCQLQENKKLAWLNRMEGGIGGDNNTIHKQIRFRHIFEGCVWGLSGRSRDNYIRFNEIYSTDSEKWTYRELYDLMYGFIKTANYYIYGYDTPVSAVCVSGSIEMSENTPAQHVRDSG